MAGNSKASVIVGVSANAVITVAKFVGFFLSGSGAMLSEAIHSVADTGNQSLLLVGLQQGSRKPDASHPYGYARDRFFWGLVSALGIFFLGAGVTLYHGIHGVSEYLSTPPEYRSELMPHVGVVTWAVLLFSLLTEGYALSVALAGTRKDAKKAGIGLRRYIKEGRDPTIAAVLMEDGAAVTGIVIAVVCIGLTELTQIAVFDAVASLLIGVLLGWVALTLVRQNRVYLTIKAVDADITEKLRAIIAEHDSVEGLADVRAVMLGVDSFHFSANVDFDGRIVAAKIFTDKDLADARAVVSDDAAFKAWVGEFSERVLQRIGVENAEIEKKVRDANPQATTVHLESSG